MRNDFVISHLKEFAVLELLHPVNLICNKLVLGLSEPGLNKYHLDIGTIVLTLMGCAEPDDNLLEVYFNYMEKARTVNDVEGNRDLLEHGQELYALLADELKARGGSVGRRPKYAKD